MPQTHIQGKRVAVTGATGFTGLHLLRRLHHDGAIAVAIVPEDAPVGKLEALSFPVERICVKNVDDLGQGILRAAPDYVVHLSAYISTNRDAHSLRESTRWNLLSTLSILTTSVEAQVKRMILMGSMEEFGQNPAPFRTSVSADPVSPYAASKAAATAYARMFHSSFQLGTVVLRPSVIYGPGQSLRMLIPMVMHALAQNQSIDVTEGKQTRDFVYVEDVVDVIVRSFTSPGIEGKSWNIGSGEVVSIRDCLERIERITGKYGLIQYGKLPYKKLEMFHYHPEVQEAYAALDWKPSVILEEGLRKTWQSYLKD